MKHVRSSRFSDYVLKMCLFPNHPLAGKYFAAPIWTKHAPRSTTSTTKIRENSAVPSSPSAHFPNLGESHQEVAMFHCKGHGHVKGAGLKLDI